MPATASAKTSSSEPSVVANASPNDATSTPRSLSLVDMSAPVKAPGPSSSASTATSAIW